MHPNILIIKGIKTVKFPSGIKIYIEPYYGVIEMPASTFDTIHEHLISMSDEKVKYMCANADERDYLSELLGVDVKYLLYGTVDYYKLLRLE